MIDFKKENKKENRMQKIKEKSRKKGSHGPLSVLPDTLHCGYELINYRDAK